MKIMSDKAVTKDDVTELHDICEQMKLQHEKEMRRLRIALAVVTVANASLAIGLHFMH